MKRCSECDRLLVTCGWGYYFHPLLVDHFKRVKHTVYQCPVAGKTVKIN